MLLGAGGQLGGALVRACRAQGVPFDASAHQQLDITEAGAVRRAVEASRCDIVVNAAAYTAVDRAEAEPAKAYAVNRDGAAYVADTCARAGLPLLHVSTDYVFDGRKAGPYREDDEVHPLSVYGASKAAGETAVRGSLERHLIVRTAWLYGPAGRNFVTTMLRLGREHEDVAVVADQRGSPTAAADLAGAIVALVRRAVRADRPSWGTYHYCGAGVTTWFGFAEAIFELAAPWLGSRPRLRPVTTDEFGAAAPRPANSALDCSRLERTFGIAPRPWRQALAAVVAEITTHSVEGV